MRLHRLQIEAFGPFAGVETIDFDRVGADGLFLLHGQTGAGKTTILDAIAFALYGAVPGVRTESKRYLSDHAAHGATPKVTLEASVQGRRFRITRTPEFDRPKKRGDGSVREKAKATLTWLGAGDDSARRENLTRIDEIADVVRELVGMSKDQFFQVVLLPQGDFARFLRASNEERERLLESLFDTKRFGSVESWFADRRREAERRVDAVRQRFELIVAKIVHSSGSEDTPEVANPAWLEGLKHDLAQRLTAAKHNAAETAEAFDRERTELDHVRSLAERQHKLRAAQAELSELAHSDAERTELARTLDRARRARPFSAAEDELHRIQRQSDQAESELKLAAESLSLIRGGEQLVEGLSWPPAAGDDSVLRQAIAAWTEESGSLKELCERAADSGRISRALTAVGRDMEKVSAMRGEAEGELASLPERIAKVESDVVAATTAQARLEPLRTAYGELEHARRAAQEARDVQQSLEAARADLTGARATYLDCREKWLEMREQRIAGMAGELASWLQQGEPCAVCGSDVHPNPAPLSDFAATREEEEAAAAAEQEAARTLERQREAVTALEKRSEALTSVTRGRDENELAQQLVAAGTSLSDTERRAETLVGLQALRNELADAEQRLEDRISDCAARLAALAERQQGLQRQLDELNAALDAARGPDASVQARKSRLDDLARAAAHLQSARNTAHTAATRLSERAAYLQTLAEQSGFDSLADARSAVRSAQWLADTEATLEAARERRVRAQAVLDDPAVKAAADQADADVPAAETRLAIARGEMESALRAHAESQRAHDAVCALEPDFGCALAELGPAAAVHARLALLSEVIAGRGQNTRRMSLRSYVLAARLEEVAVAASGRLRVMSGGRYEFVHSDAAGPRGLRGGLGLDIRDDYTGVVRSAKTLSGGETFMASLALALGLADVVTAESGGIMLDTLFIDEGFGTLDSDTLDSVMGVLDELRAGGRVVGLVSHVDEMRQRIPSRLHVVKARSGSHVRATASG
ncbi:SMC family ATPase [Hoyosella sp. YIM 151337]|uniref:AAA family ATPase n=1 Tax=Hoyosella sp. YIM 151337 TaxID=2992742 RepID=UPI00223691C8|nr:SMC family ATPase [Hoyosella sp. YIM 151337]MCW4355073.1 SMC family ATPase [Hoyosella sp. YIM 151337]